MSVEFPFQQALYDVLIDANGGLGVQGVYDSAPQAADGGDVSLFPYVVMGGIQAVQMDTQTKNGWQMNVRIHTWSRTGSMRECKEVQARLYGLLHRRPMTFAGFNNFELLRADSDCNMLQDGRTHGLCEYVGLVEVATPVPTGPAFDSGFSLGFA